MSEIKTKFGGGLRNAGDLGFSLDLMVADTRTPEAFAAVRPVIETLAVAAPKSSMNDFNQYVARLEPAVKTPTPVKTTTKPGTGSTI